MQRVDLDSRVPQREGHTMSDRPGRTRRQARTALAVLALLGLVLWAPAPAHADGSVCSGDTGVSVVVDYGDLGGDVEQACVQDGAGKMAADVFEEAGHELTPVGAFPGAACKVDDLPDDVACAKMPPANAYWGLYVGTKGKWGYAPKGADELKMADGDFVAFAWQSTKTSTPPSVAPVAASPSATSDQAASSAPEQTAADEEDDGGVAWWIPVGVVVLLLVAGAAVAVRRRTGSA
jgi:hypothetical protein